MQQVLSQVQEINDMALMPFRVGWYYLSTYGWYIVGALSLSFYLYIKLKPMYKRWQDERWDAKYHKNPDIALSRMEAIQRAREKQQEELLERSRIAAERQKELEEKKRLELEEKRRKYEASLSGHRLGSPDDNDSLPLSRGESSSNYRPPKRSACSRGGCGR